MAEGKDDLEKYLDDSLQEKDRHALEKKALNDAFLADAVDGAETISPLDFSSDVAGLRKKIQEKSSRSWFTPLRIAAGVILFLGTSSLIYFIGFQPQDNLAEESDVSSKVEETATAGKASDSTLITMAKPESEMESKKELPQPGKAKNVPAKREASAIDLKSTGDTQKGESEKSGPVLATEDKAELKQDETKDDRVAEVAPVQSVPLIQQNELRKKENNSAGLSNSKSLKVNQQVIDGNVKAEDGSPIAGVNVVLKGTSQGTVTDSNGYFTLPVADNTQPLIFSFIGMESREIAPREETHLQVTLREDASQLSEVVVTGLAVNDNQKENPVIKNATPVGGIKAYNQYLENSLRYPQQAIDNKIKGKVTVSFTIYETGVLSDFTVVKGLGYGCDDEVIRLVKEGPRWTPTTVNSTPVQTEVKVRVKFDPEKAKK